MNLFCVRRDRWETENAGRHKGLVANSGEALLSFEPYTLAEYIRWPEVNCSLGLHPKLHATTVSI